MITIKVETCLLLGRVDRWFHLGRSVCIQKTTIKVMETGQGNSRTMWDELVFNHIHVLNSWKCRKAKLMQFLPVMMGLSDIYMSKFVSDEHWKMGDKQLLCKSVWVKDYRLDSITANNAIRNVDLRRMMRSGWKNCILYILVRYAMLLSLHMNLYTTTCNEWHCFKMINTNKILYRRN